MYWNATFLYQADSIAEIAIYIFNIKNLQLQGRLENVYLDSKIPRLRVDGEILTTALITTSSIQSVSAH